MLWSALDCSNMSFKNTEILSASDWSIPAPKSGKYVRFRVKNRLQILSETFQHLTRVFQGLKRLKVSRHLDWAWENYNIQAFIPKLFALSRKSLYTMCNGGFGKVSTKQIKRNEESGKVPNIWKIFTPAPISICLWIRKAPRTYHK